MEQFKLNESQAVAGEFVDLDGERYYKISNVDKMPPFFISVVSASNHWLFISSTGSLSAGRVKPENALFPYRSVDHIHENAQNTGAKGLFKVTQKDGTVRLWEPFNENHDGLYDVERHVYKNAVGDKIVFEEINRTLQLKYTYSWKTSDKYGFVRQTHVTNLDSDSRKVSYIDGIQNLLPSGAPLSAMQTRSALVDAYKWNEKVVDQPLALYTMYAKLSDRAEPAESLRATTVFSLSDENQSIFMTSSQLANFRKGVELKEETLRRGERGAYFVHSEKVLAGGEEITWTMVADIDQNHADIVDLKNELSNESQLLKEVKESVDDNHNELVSLMSGADAWQMTSEEETSVHHYANVLFNNMRGGIFLSGYHLDVQDVIATMSKSNQQVAMRHQAFFDALQDGLTHPELVKLAKETGDSQLVRLAYEYLPLTFGRRHGDPSRPWNHFEIKVRGENGESLLSYQGNWRDIFQNWEASALSYPSFITAFISKFVNASTVDGYNPYRITKDGVDWELLEPDDPWSNIGYWGDHQIIYLLKFLELANQYQKPELIELLSQEIFSYANVPYELCDVEKLFDNPKDTVTFNDKLQAFTELKSEQLGSDGRLVLTKDDEVYQVNLIEKMLVPLLAKLSNLVVDGGIWLNTQRPEWNDANNAIVGNGLSMVTLYYMRRYVAFLQTLLCHAQNQVTLSNEVLDWMVSVSEALKVAAGEIRRKTVTRQTRKSILTSLAKAADDYRQRVYKNNGFSGKTNIDLAAVKQLVDTSLEVLDDSIKNNKREDGLYNAYNIINYSNESVSVEELYPMLEGQVSILSSGYLKPAQVVKLLDNLFASDMYREDQHSFMLYPDRQLNMFMARNVISAEQVDASPLLKAMIEEGDSRIVSIDAEGVVHFHADFDNVGFLTEKVAQVKKDYPQFDAQEWTSIEETYEDVFNHKAFTGRSGTMFGYEGLGCIYWHMVSKLLLAVQENYRIALLENPESQETKQLLEYYYKVRDGIGFNKTPDNYGAFPTDPYSHTPKQLGAQQPGMTGQVKEEIITRFGELGLFVEEGEISIQPTMLHAKEFVDSTQTFRLETVFGDKQAIVLEKDSLAFTYCQVPFVYHKTEETKLTIKLELNSGELIEINSHVIPSEYSQDICQRLGGINKVRVYVPKNKLI